MASESERVLVIRDEAGTYVVPEQVLHQYRASDEDAAAWEQALSSATDTAGFLGSSWLPQIVYSGPLSLPPTGISAVGRAAAAPPSWPPVTQGPVQQI